MFLRHDQRKGLPWPGKPIALALLVTIVLTGCSMDPRQKYARFLALGNKQLEGGDYSRASLNFRNAIQTQPKDAEAYYRLALSYLGAGQLQEGVSALRQATEINPAHTAAQLKLAELMIQTQDRETVQDAEGRIQRVLAQDPGNEDALFDFAATQAQLGRPEEAEKYLDNILEKSPGNLKSAIAFAQIKLSKKDFKAAEGVMTKFTDQYPNSPDAAIALGVVYAATGNLESAEVQFRRALRLSPQNASALTALGAIQLRDGKTAEADHTYRQLAQLPQKQHRLTYAKFLMRQDRRQDAVRELERLVNTDPNDRQTRSALVDAYVTTDRREDAEGVLNKALNKNPKDVEALVQRSQISLQMGSYAAAQRDVEQILRTDPGSAQAHFLMAKVYSGQGDLLRAKAELTRTLEVAPHFLPARVDLANVLLTSNNPEAALQTLNDADEKQKRVVLYVLARTWALIALGNRTEARANVAAVLKVARIADALLQDAVLKFAARDFAGARASLEEVLKSNPEDTRALSVLTQTYRAQKQASIATEKLRSYVQQRPKSARLQMFWAKWLLENGKRAEAREALAAAETADPKHPAAEIALARLDFDEGNLAAARQRLTTVISANRKDVEANLMLAGVEDASGNYQAAIDYYLRTLEGDERNVAALNNLAYDLSRDSTRLDDALRYGQKAEELAPENSYTRDTLGWIYYRKGLYQLAVKELESALAKEARPGVQFHLGLAYRRVGNLKEAGPLLAAALAARPDLAKTEPIP